MKTAVIVAGVCRFSDIAHRSWNIFPDADWYLSTWDISQAPYSREAEKSSVQIDKIKHKFKSITISNYKEKYLDTDSAYSDRPFLLLEKVYNEIKDSGYQRIIYFRPDLVLFKMNQDLWPKLNQYTFDVFDENDFAIDDSQVKVAYGHVMDTFWVDHANKIMQDSFFLFSWNNFVKFLKEKRKITVYGDVHRGLYNYFKESNIEPAPLDQVCVTILRNNIYQNLDKTNWYEMSQLFDETYNRFNHVGKFIKEIELKEIALPDLAKLEESKRSGGILKLRNK